MHTIAHQKKERLDRLLANLGYGNRKDVQRLIRRGDVKINGEIIKDISLKVLHGDVLVNDEPLDPIELTIVINKPAGYVCSHDSNEGKTIYSLLPQRWQCRTPKLSTIGRLDKDTTGVIILTTDGKLNHTLSSPKSLITKIYEVTLASSLSGDEIEAFGSGSMILHGEEKPCLPAKMYIMDNYHAVVEIVEGRYHQVKRMFGAVGNKVVALHRSRFGDYTCDGLGNGEYIRINVPLECPVSIGDN
jgi:16S rRNA pseudouridine516 synthase